MNWRLRIKKFEKVFYEFNYGIELAIGFSALNEQYHLGFSDM